MEKPREHTLDMLRGLAAISVINIHTTFGSGLSYVPEWMRQISLMFDVPVFFFLAGWTLTLKSISLRTLLGLLNLYVDYLIFSTGAILFCLAMGTNSWNDLLRVVMLQGFGTENLPIAGASMWFVKVYLACMLIFYFAHGVVTEKNNANRFLLLGILCVIASLLIVFRQFSYISFYFIFIFTGWGFAKKGFSPWYMILLASVMFVMVLLYEFSPSGKSFHVYLMTFSKFPPDGFYLLLSLPSIGFCMFAQGFAWKNRLIEWIGRNALWVYFAQGISGSLLYKVAPGKLEGGDWVAAWILMFCLNIMLALPIAFLLRSLITPLREYLVGVVRLLVTSLRMQLR